MMRKSSVSIALLLGLVMFSSLAQAEVKLTANLLKTNMKQGWTRLQGQVHVVKIESGLDLKAERLEFFRDPEAVSLFQLQAEGGVLLTLGNRSFKAQTLRYNHITGHILMQGAVQMEASNTTVEAEQFEFFTKEKKGVFTAIKGDRVRLKTGNPATKDKEKQAVEVLAEEIRFSQVENKVHLQGDVYLRDEEKDTTLKAERAELFFDGKNNLQEMRASGQFSLEQPWRESRADQAVLNYQKQRIILTGKAYVKDRRQGILRSEHIEMHMNAKKGIVRSQRNQLLKMEIQLD